MNSSAASDRRANRGSAWLGLHDPALAISLSRPAAVGLTLVLYVGAFGPGVYGIISVYREHGRVAVAASPAGSAVSVTCEALIAVVAGLATVRCLSGTWRPVFGAATWRREIVAGSLFVTMAAVSGWLMAVIPNQGFPIHTAAGHLGDAITFLRAGPFEEICALVTPLVILRAGRVPWLAVFAVLVAIRVSYHLYYGAGAVVVILWASGTVFVYLWARSIIGIAVAHSFYDLTGLPSELGHQAISALLYLLLVLSCLIVSVRFCAGLARRHTPGRARCPCGEAPL